MFLCLRVEFNTETQEHLYQKADEAGATAAAATPSSSTTAKKLESKPTTSTKATTSTDATTSDDPVVPNLSGKMDRAEHELMLLKNRVRDLEACGQHVQNRFKNIESQLDALEAKKADKKAEEAEAEPEEAEEAEAEPEEAEEAEEEAEEEEEEEAEEDEAEEDEEEVPEPKVAKKANKDDTNLDPDFKVRVRML